MGAEDKVNFPTPYNGKCFEHLVETIFLFFSRVHFRNSLTTVYRETDWRYHSSKLFTTEVFQLFTANTACHLQRGGQGCRTALGGRFSSYLLLSLLFNSRLFFIYRMVLFKAAICNFLGNPTKFT